MSKELEALEWLNYYKNKLNESQITFRDRGFDIIETQLKDYEETDNQIYDLFEKYGINHRKDLLKQLKAFEIIKAKDVDVVFVKRYQTVVEYNEAMDYIEYNGGDFTEHLTQEEYELLKEVLV